MQGGTFSKPQVEQQNEYITQLKAADRYMQESDYPQALEIYLKLAEKGASHRLLEKIAVAYDGDRQSDKAFEYFRNAAELAIEAKDINMAKSIVSRMQLMGRDKARTAELSAKIKAMEQTKK